MHRQTENLPYSWHTRQNIWLQYAVLRLTGIYSCYAPPATSHRPFWPLVAKKNYFKLSLNVRHPLGFSKCILTIRDQTGLQRGFTSNRSSVLEGQIKSVCVETGKVSRFDVVLKADDVVKLKRSPQRVCRVRWAALRQSSSSWSSAPPAASPLWPEEEQRSSSGFMWCLRDVWGIWVQ